MASSGEQSSVSAAEEGSASGRGPAADPLLCRICERAWSHAADLTQRLDAAGFGPGRWPTWESLQRVVIRNKLDIPKLQAARPPLGGLEASDATPHTLFYSAGGILEPNMPTAEARLADIMREIGFGPGDIVLNGFSYHLAPAGWLFHGGLVGAGCTALPGGTHNAEALYEFMARTRATGFVGIASHLKLILDQAVQAGRDPRRELGLRKAIAGAEPIAAPIRRQLAEQYGIDARDIYGAAEVGVVGFECEHRSGMHLHAQALVEVIDPETGARMPDGEPGHIVLTVDTPEYPMLRLGTGDLGTVTTEQCACGRASMRIAGLLGRVGVSARVRGILLHEAQVREALHAHPAILGGAVDVLRLDGRDALTALLVVSPQAEPSVVAAFRERFTARCRLNVDRVETSEAPLPSGPVIRDRRFAAGGGQP